jgi:hypothetical protein
MQQLILSSVSKNQVGLSRQEVEGLQQEVGSLRHALCLPYLFERPDFFGGIAKTSASLVCAFASDTVPRSRTEKSQSRKLITWIQYEQRMQHYLIYSTRITE